MLSLKIHTLKFAMVQMLPVLLVSVVMVSCKKPGKDLEKDMTISFAGGIQAEEASSKVAARRAPAAEGDLEMSLPAGDKTFKVFAVKNAESYTGKVQTVIDGYTVSWVNQSANSTVSNTADWEYVDPDAGQTIKYWDFSADNYRFFAVASAGKYGNGDSYAVQPYTVDGDAWKFSVKVDAGDEEAVPYISKLAYVLPVAYKNTVQMSFYKPLCRVRVVLVDEDGAPLGLNEMAESVKRMGFKPVGAVSKIATQGTLDVSYPVKGTAMVESFAVTPSETAALDSITMPYVEEGEFTYIQPTLADPEKPRCWYTLLPNVSQNVAFELSLVVRSEIMTAVVPAEYMNWKPNFSYTYRFKVSNFGVMFLDVIQVGIRDWTPVSDTHFFYNW